MDDSGIKIIGKAEMGLTKNRPYDKKGPVEITRQGNLKIGRITMQRKGGDGGRETAKMLQFKINPL